MIKLLVLLALAIGAFVVPALLREALGWVLAFLSLLMLGDLARSSLPKRRDQVSPSAPRRP